MKTKVKICGIRTLPAAMESIRSGADFLGFNFVRTSRRYIDPLKALEIISQLSKETKIVGVFRNETIEFIKKMIEYLRLDFVQLHGREGPDYSRLTQYAGVIKAIPFFSHYTYRDAEREFEKYDVDYFLLDRPVQGEGAVINLSHVAVLCRCHRLFLAGGLNTENVRTIIDRVRPYALDVASFLETGGVQNIDKIRQFITAVKGEI